MSESKSKCRRCDRPYVPELLEGINTMSSFCEDCMVRNLLDGLEMPTPPELLDKHSKMPTLSRAEFRKMLNEIPERKAERSQPIKRFFWKLRYSWRLRGLLRLPWLMCWENAGAALETTNGDLEECPEAAAEDEADVWRQDAG